MPSETPRGTSGYRVDQGPGLWFSGPLPEGRSGQWEGADVIRGARVRSQDMDMDWSTAVGAEHGGGGAARLSLITGRDISLGGGGLTRGSLLRTRRWDGVRCG